MANRLGLYPAFIIRDRNGHAVAQTSDEEAAWVIVRCVNAEASGQ